MEELESTSTEIGVIGITVAWPAQRINKIIISELREEKVAPHKDAWTKFLSNEDPGQRTVFECEFEDKVLAVRVLFLDKFQLI